MAKAKECSFCNKQVPKLWYSNPPCCPSYTCIAAYKRLKSEKHTETPKKKKVSYIKPVSDRRAEEMKEYRKRRDQFLKENSVCMFPGCHSFDVTLHHAAGRIGKLLIEVKHFRSLCPQHHRWVEEHPNEAKAMNLSTTRTNK